MLSRSYTKEYYREQYKKKKLKKALDINKLAEEIKKENSTRGQRVTKVRTDR